MSVPSPGEVWHQSMVDKAVLLLVDLPVERRPPVLTEMGVDYEAHLESAGIPRCTVVMMSRLWTFDVLKRVKEINITSGNAAGRA